MALANRLPRIVDRLGKPRAGPSTYIYQWIIVARTKMVDAPPASIIPTITKHPPGFGIPARTSRQTSDS
jgi:hypothetical protein